MHKCRLVEVVDFAEVGVGWRRMAERLREFMQADVAAHRLTHEPTPLRIRTSSILAGSAVTAWRLTLQTLIVN